LATIGLEDYRLLPLSDESALVRASSIRALSNAPADTLIALAAPALDDASRGVRIEAAHLLAAAPPEALSVGLRASLEAGVAEYVESQKLAADTPAAQLNMALLHHELGEESQAEARYRRALSLDPYFLPAHFNLATMLNAQGRNPEAATVLREAILRDPEEGELNFSLSLLLAEQGDMAGAAKQLERAAELLPMRARVHYNLGLTKQHLGERQAAEAALLRALVIERREPDFIYALAIFYMQGEDWAQARRYAQLLCDELPSQAGPIDLRERIEKSAEAAAQRKK
jgi:Tfp pilus assembly protein PilF